MKTWRHQTVNILTSNKNDECYDIYSDLKLTDISRLVIDTKKLNSQVRFGTLSISMRLLLFN